MAAYHVTSPPADAALLEATARGMGAWVRSSSPAAEGLHRIVVSDVGAVRFRRLRAVVAATRAVREDERRNVLEAVRRIAMAPGVFSASDLLERLDAHVLAMVDLEGGLGPDGVPAREARP